MSEQVCSLEHLYRSFQLLDLGLVSFFEISRSIAIVLKTWPFSTTHIYLVEVPPASIFVPIHPHLDPSHIKIRVVYHFQDVRYCGTLEGPCG